MKLSSDDMIEVLELAVKASANNAPSYDILQRADAFRRWLEGEAVNRFGKFDREEK